ncbi:MAG TPA: YitT family protein [Clostridia bacterium]|nr:YitT family protein [Clostridia bacterium]
MQKASVKYFLDALILVIGSGLVALGLSMFTIPNDIAPGGVSGISTALSHIVKMPVGMLMLIFNIPLLVLAWRRLGLKPLAKTFTATILLSFGIDIFSVILPGYTNNILLASLMGGVVMGAGLGILLSRGISTGGTDLLGLMLVKLHHGLSMGQLLMLIDTAIVLFAALVFKNIEVALYSLVTLFITSKTIDAIQQGVDHAKVVYIVTTQADALLKRLAQEMGRGVTVLPALGGFTGEAKSVLMTIARRSEVSLTLQVIHELDPFAFTILSDATSVHGEGFKNEQ